MLPSYNDIISRLGPPLWWDENGVPRYATFHPTMCGIYAGHVAFMVISCHACHSTFRVAVSLSRHEQVHLPDTRKSDPWDAVGSFHYGDPPRHSGENCPAGDTMNSIPVRILEFWTRSSETKYEWKRFPECEVEFEQGNDAGMPI